MSQKEKTEKENTRSIDSPRHFIIWKDQKENSFQAKDSGNVEMESLDENVNLAFLKFLKAHNCYDLIPTSAKLLVLDTQLGVKKAFLALIWNSLRAAPLWDGGEKAFVGMLTITDFIKILFKYYKEDQEHIPELETHKIKTWKEALGPQNQSMVSIHSDLSLHEAILCLCQHKIHRLPVVDKDSGNILYILTHKRILRFLYLYISDLPQPSFLKQSIKELNVGTYGNIITITKDTKLVRAIGLFVTHRVSALPVVDEEGVVRDVYAKFDVFNLAADKSYTDLNQTIENSFCSKRQKLEDVCTCKHTDPLGSVMEKIVKAEVHRLVVVDQHRKVMGVVSLSDILHFLASDEGSAQVFKKHESI